MPEKHLTCGEIPPYVMYATHLLRAGLLYGVEDGQAAPS